MAISLATFVFCGKLDLLTNNRTNKQTNKRTNKRTIADSRLFSAKPNSFIIYLAINLTMALNFNANYQRLELVI